MQDLLTCSDEEVARALCERTHVSLYRALADAGMTHDRVSTLLGCGNCRGPCPKMAGKALAVALVLLSMCMPRCMGSERRPGWHARQPWR